MIVDVSNLFRDHVEGETGRAADGAVRPDTNGDPHDLVTDVVCAALVQAAHGWVLSVT
jgi:hypothetical protein